MIALEWEDCTDSLAMLEYLRQHTASWRKLRLFGCARCRFFWHLVTDERARTAIQVSEQYADDQVGIEELQAASNAVWASGIGQQGDQGPSGRVVLGVASLSEPTGEGCWDTAWEYYNGASPEEVAAMDSAAKAEVSLIKDIFGNPFRPVPELPRNPTTQALAHAAYDERELPSGHLDPTRLAILADALEEAGCGDEEVLNHLRGEGVHVRGCHVVDLVLGKE